MDQIDKNIEAFNKMRNELEKSSINKWALFQDAKFIDVFDDFEDAAQFAYSRFKVGTYLIRQVGVSSLVLPVSFMR